MQRLYCINNKPIPGKWNKPCELAAIKEGQEYEGEVIMGRNPDFSLVESWLIPSVSNVVCYDIRRFIPLPDTTADDMQEESREAIVNLETA